VKRLGFTLVELALVLVLMGLVIAMALPKLRTAWARFNVRAARIAFDAVAARARAAAVQRGCVSTLNFTSGSSGNVWVTACPASGSAASDTVGPMEFLGTRYGVSLSSSQSSVRYDPRGVSVGGQTVTVLFTASAGGKTDSAMINRLGKVVR
jgi:prepilin-type N-terminal cleavage/methylation domain-containing protein